MNNETTISRKGQIHRTWVRKMIDEVKEKVEKYAEEMKDDAVQNFIDYMERVDEKIKLRKKEKGFELMVGRYKNLAKDDFIKQIKRQIEAFKKSRDNEIDDEIDDEKLLEGLN